MKLKDVCASAPAKGQGCRIRSYSPGRALLSILLVWLLVGLVREVHAEEVIRVDKVVENGQWKIQVLAYERTSKRANFRLRIFDDNRVFWKLTFRFLAIPALAKKVKNVRVRHRLDYSLEEKVQSALSGIANVNLDGSIELLFAIPPAAQPRRIVFNAEVTPKYRRLWSELPPLSFEP